MDPTSRVFVLNSLMLNNGSDSIRSFGYSVRCFYDNNLDEYDGSLTITFDSK
ncbi:hypothetical protein J6T66_02720 [bacterium]|nr:hypothetical protein [bacterium]